jgi:5-methylcytosine-specific restriction endonuclease McrA
MAQPQLQAKFFVAADGAVFIREEPLKRSVAYRIFKRDNETCQCCGEKVKFGGNTVSPFCKVRSGHIDHIFPRSRGGRNADSNLRLLCISCNASKGAK